MLKENYFNISRILGSLFLTILLVTQTFAVEKPFEEKLRVGYVLGGVYEQYVNQKLSDINIPGLLIELVPTQGSREQIELLKKGDIDFALVQSDIAYYAYEGQRGYKRYSEFSLVLPLFEEYIQILVRDHSGIYTLGNLFEGVISSGSKGSGTFHNSSDLFNELGFRPGIDFEQQHLPILEGLQSLKDGNIDGVINTSGAFPSNSNPEEVAVRALDIPESVLEAMALKSAYYSKTSVLPWDLSNKVPISTVAVTALLVASSDLDPEIVAKVIEILLGKGNELKLKSGQVLKLQSPESAINQAPIPLHEGLRIHLINNNHIGQDYSVGVIFIVFIMLIGFVATVQLRMRSYDRIGNLTASKGTITYSLYELIAKSGAGLIVLFVFIMLVVVFVEAIQFVETEYARRLNVKNPFADRGFQNSFLWVITFMGAGDPGDVFPNSPIGKLLASVLPFLGLGAVLGFGYSTLEQRREKRAKAREGTLTRSIRDHVLLCGWNEKAPGIIYTLTSSDVPRKRQIIVIAELDGDAPLERYNFDLKYVSYCKGDSADYQVLERANAGYADVAVVLGGAKKRKGKNVKSVLSAMALCGLAERNAERKKKLMLIAELMFEENKTIFQACGADHIVSSEIITDRISAMSCLYSPASDFILDLLTYDDKSELYVLPFNEIKTRLGLDILAESNKKTDVLDLNVVADKLWPLGINVVASNNTKFSDSQFLDHTFTGEKFGMLQGHRALTVGDEHELLVIADDFSDVKKVSKKAFKSDLLAPPKEYQIELPRPLERKIILVGDLSRCLRVAKELKGFPYAKVTIFSQTTTFNDSEGIVFGDVANEEKWLEAGLAEADQITILSQCHSELNQSNVNDMASLDAEVLFASRFAYLYSKKVKTKECHRSIEITAEMLSPANTKLFEDAGVDVVIPTSRIIERVITKLIYSRGTATRFLMALLRFDDKKHLITFKLSDSKKNMSLTDLKNSLPDYFQLLGVLPSNENGRENWLNNVGDFRYHFLTTTTHAVATNYTAKDGDVLVGIIDQASWFSAVTDE